MSVSNRIEEDFRPVIEELGYELVYVEYAKEGQDWFLRFFIDRPEGIFIEDCEKVSRHVEVLLDEKDYVKAQYILEVSSLGLERPLRNEQDFLNNIGEIIEVSLFKPLDKKKKYRGVLSSYGGQLVLLADGREVTIDLENISKANISIDI